jgi:Spy/CpxP family protein refolding chaperone
MENLKIILAMVGLVAIGFAGGFFMHQTMVKKAMEERALHGPRIPLGEKMIEILDLTEEQAKKLKPIMEDHHAKMRELDRTVRAGRKELFGSLKNALEAELTPDQHEKFQEFMQKQRNFHRGRKDRQKRREDRKMKYEEHGE